MPVVKEDSTCATIEIETPYGMAIQEMTAEALAVIKDVRDGVNLYKGGRFGNSETDLTQFWSPSSVLEPGAAQRLGIPPENERFDFVIRGKLLPQAPVVTRSAPGVDSNPGGAIEAVTNPGAVWINSFHMPPDSFED